MDQVSVIIISYNTRDITDKCLASIKEPAEIIVVDNASTDGSVEMIKEKYPKVKLIESKTNTGFTSGNNLGMQQARGKYILLLNSDAFLQRDTLAKCVQYMGKNMCDVMGCKLTFADGRLQPSAGALPTPFNVLQWVFGLGGSYHPKNPAFFATNHPVGWVTGAFMFLRREVFEKTGGFDEHYFMYAEEVDWCKRMADMGLRVDFVADFSITHLQAASSGYAKPFIREMQGVDYYFKKHYASIYPLMHFIIKSGNYFRILLFTVVGNKRRADIYREIVQTL